MDKIIEQQRKHFDEISKRYFDARQNENHLFYKELMWRNFFKKIDKYFNKKKYNCLEAMCGYAEGFKIIKNFSNINIDYKGFDYSEELVQIANENSPELNIINGNILTYKDENNYDLIILLGGLHHVYKNVDKALENINKLIERDSFFINLEPTHNNLFFKKIREKIYKSNDLFDDESEQAFELIELNNLFIKNGYEKVEQIYPGLLGYILYYNPDAFQNLNIGNKTMVKFIFMIEKYFFNNFIGRYFSFATLSLWRKK
ncbi:methyltransferase domain-containing protein [Aliarcobacter cryaerophilus]|uniref:methyltransferase domain-containing protein n=1 Tax=Aliarcobacter cryaerophilus TaxID=28198 RepID=UPI003DA58CA9